MNEGKEERKKYLIDYVYYQINKAKLALQELVDMGYNFEDIKYIIERVEELVGEHRNH